MKIGKDRLSELINNGLIGVILDNGKELIPYIEIQRFIKDNLVYRKSTCEPQILKRKKDMINETVFKNKTSSKSTNDLFNEIILEN
ncbi:MAG: hypothetical protein GXX85_17455 [Ignavibacteria bacterium]|nr:hypothetical protein [Ignavibacteria bacterium]